MHGTLKICSQYDTGASFRLQVALDLPLTKFEFALVSGQVVCVYFDMATSCETKEHVACITAYTAQKHIRGTMHWSKIFHQQKLFVANHNI